MAFVSGLIVLDAPASALNNAGNDPMASTDNVVTIKKIKTPQGILPYVSAQAFRYWLRTTLESCDNDWVAAPVFREGKIAYTDANPVKNWDDDLFGYMRAPSKKADAIKDEKITPLEKDRDITRVSPFRVSTFVAVAPSPVIKDFGTMARQDGDPVPHEHEFYRAHLQGLVSLDLTSAGTFFDNEKVGYKNLDSFRREEAQKEAGKPITVRGQKAFRLPLDKRQKRVSALLRALGELNGGAKQTVHYTDLTPAIIMFAVIKSGNHPFYRVLHASKTHQTEFSPEVLEELISTYRKDIVSPIYIGWAKGFLDSERAKMEETVKQFSNIKFNIGHPKQVIELLANDAADSKNAGWYE